MPQNTARGVPYVVGSDVAGAYPETSVNLANYINDRLVQKSGDQMTGPLEIKQANDYSQVKLMAAADGYWISVDPGAGGMSIAYLNAAGAFQKSYMVFKPSGTTEVVGNLKAAGLAAISGQTSAGHSWLVRWDASGEIKTIPDSIFRLIVAAIGQTSTRRLKTKIRDGGSPDVTRLQPRAYEWTDEAFKVSSPGTRLGLIAEEVAEVDRRLVTVDEQGDPAGLDAHALIAALIAKVTELQARIETLEART